MAISRDEVLHVARLARLALTDEEVERLTEELGAILDAVGVVAELDLARRPADVPPARPRQRMGRGRAARFALPGRRVRERAGSRRRPLPRPAGRRMIDTLRLTAEGAMALLERRRGVVRRAACGVPRRDRRARRRAALLPAHVRRTPSGDGIPIALKDVISTKGIETTAGSKILSGYTPVFDATVAARVKAAGLSLLGKTNTDEFAMGSSTENSAWGPTRNPWDPSRVPGGSGGGTAAAVSAGLAPWGLGSDTGGSIKQPSALCGNVGLRPTYGTVSRYGVVAFASSLDQIGPVAKTVRDVALLYSIIAGRDPLDSTTAELPEPVQLPEGDSLAGLRLAVPKQVEALDAIEPGVRAAFEQSLEHARELGAEVGECDLPLSYRYGMPCYYLVAPAEASSNLARYDGVRYGPRVEGATYDEMVDRTRDEGFGPEPKRRIMLGTYALAAGYYDAFYGQAQKVRTLLIREHREALDGFDAIVTPTSPTVAFPIGDKAADPLAMYACDLLTIPSCLAGPARPVDPVRPLGRAAGRVAADRAAVRRERTLPRRATRSSRRSGSTPSRSASDDVGAGHRARDPRPAEDAHEDVLPLPCRIRSRREHADVSGLSRVPRRAAGDEPPRDRVDDQARARARLRDRRARGLRAQELLLPGSPQGLSDLTIRSAFLH